MLTHDCQQKLSTIVVYVAVCFFKFYFMYNSMHTPHGVHNELHHSHMKGVHEYFIVCEVPSMWDGCNAVYTPLSTHSIVLVLFLIDQETWFFFWDLMIRFTLIFLMWLKVLHFKTFHLEN